MALVDLDLRVRQMHASLADLSTQDLGTVVSRAGVEHDGRFSMSVDFSEGVPDTALATACETLVYNIARLKDHLDAWCRARGVPFDGDAVIDSTDSTKLVHDLWNAQKHGMLTRRTRSGKKPQLANVRRVMTLWTGGSAGSATILTFGRDGKPIVHSTGGGKAELVIDGDIVDEQGTFIAAFLDTCEAAVARWEQALLAVGVPVATR